MDFDLPAASERPPRRIFEGEHECEIIPSYTKPPKFRVKCLIGDCGWVPLQTFNSRSAADDAVEDHQVEMRAKTQRRRARQQLAS